MTDAPEPHPGGERPAEPSRLSAVGVVGAVGASFTVYEADWVCACGVSNKAARRRCVRCREPKVMDAGAVRVDGALGAYLSGEDHGWREAYDTSSGHVYYHNAGTGESRWERPPEMGDAPAASGWFGRASGAQEGFEEEQRKLLERPARKQREVIEAHRYVREVSGDLNVWYGKRVGDDWNARPGAHEAADSRCDVARDTGHTKADKSSSGRRLFCIHFARGCCAKGADCAYFHRVPTRADDAALDRMHDCFGREKHRGHRDDMDGVGSYEVPCRTLYVGRLVVSQYEGADAARRAVQEDFGAFGEVENVHVVPRINAAFVRYRLQSSAQFAKEAMRNQSLRKKEVLNVRWAYDDPNPTAREAAARADEDVAIAMVRARNAGASEGEPRGGKRLRAEGSADRDDGIPLPEGWTSHLDETYGRLYYHNATTGESSWTRPAGAPVGRGGEGAAAQEGAPDAGSAEEDRDRESSPK